MQLHHSLGVRQKLTPVLSTSKADEILVLGPHWTQQISRSQGKASHGMYSNPGTQVKVQNKDFGTVS